MLELYGIGSSRWVKCYWMLKEIGVDFKEYLTDPREAHKDPDILEMNPFGKIPILKDGSFFLYESTAILNYLGEKFPESKLIPLSGSNDRAYYDQWMSFCLSELETPLWRILKHSIILPENKRIHADTEYAKEEFNSIVKILEKEIGDKQYLVGNHFTAVDISMAYTLGWAQFLGLLEDYGNCSRYRNSLIARPTFPVHLFKR
ncbi:glutathione S-transferase family protein [Pigmentibacter ruber]